MMLSSDDNHDPRAVRIVFAYVVVGIDIHDEYFDAEAKRQARFVLTLELEYHLRQIQFLQRGDHDYHLSLASSD